jgi:tRNA pseudouridine38-40 synthase
MTSKSVRLMGKLSFIGTPYQGWQTQKQGGSVQEKVEEVFSKILQQKIKVYGASRTDAGVHAKGFIFHVDVSLTMPTAKLRHAFNRIIDETIFLVKLQIVPKSFEARYQHGKKTYTYQVLTKDRDPFLKDTTLYIPYSIDLKKLKPVLKLFEGKNNFSAFTTKKEDGAHFIRTIYSIKVRQEGTLFKFTFVGDGFMTYMIRMIMGTLLAYQQDKLSLATIQGFLNQSIRGPVSYKVAPHGLCLMKVQYDH